MSQRMKGIRRLTIAETAAELGVNIWKVRRWVHSGRIRAEETRRGHKYTNYRIAPSELRRIKYRLDANLPI